MYEFFLLKEFIPPENTPEGSCIRSYISYVLVNSPRKKRVVRLLIAGVITILFIFNLCGHCVMASYGGILA